MICGQPVSVPGVFSSTSTDLGRTCQRESGHSGPHRWQAKWEGVPESQVEADIARDLATWEPSEEDEEPERG